ncbi:hypothetical protein MJO28_008188 [Puccinia striiformis f. sp. tritici]|uniref:Uncharacterized protein n=1 Tax=Puccinia striiformis f. sp. tritici TaxID=168172 RepID=A0ACC0E9T1_9BASI|nr:hypothetical protein MJO28_008188 [Puccinia striiformis f. sp. tritici]KAI7952469.1 hypothetical protein MJO29_008100 [Puccinia striiformis f. sp. tritici]
MFLMIKSFLGGYLILIPLLIMLYSRGAVATKRRCDSYFGPSKNPERNCEPEQPIHTSPSVTKFSTLYKQLTTELIVDCSSDGVRYSCAVDSCKAKNKLWSSFRFRNCYMIVHGLVTTFRKEEVNPVQFHTLWWTVSELGPGLWRPPVVQLRLRARLPHECFEAHRHAVGRPEGERFCLEEGIFNTTTNSFERNLATCLFSKTFRCAVPAKRCLVQHIFLSPSVTDNRIVHVASTQKCVTCSRCH